MKHFDSTEAFRYVWVNWTIIGLSPLPHRSRAYKVYSIILTLTMPIIPAVQQIIQLFFGESVAAITSNLYVSLEWVCGNMKHFLVVLWYRKLYSSHHFLARLDARLRQSPEELAMMKGIVKTCHRVYYVYNVTYWINVVFYFINNLIFHRLMYESYFPWNWKASYRVYLMVHIYELVTTLFQCIMNMTIDCASISYLCVMLGHVKTLGMRISRIGYDPARSEEENYNDLIECVFDYKNILQFFDQFRPIVGMTIFVQFFVTAFSLCLSIFYYLYFNNSFGVLLSTGTFLGLLFAEITPCCYLVNDLMIVSDNLTTDLYSCNWMEQNLKFRKALIIFMQRSQKTNTILAANLAPVTLQTCFMILRFSFSVFTVLSQF